MNRFLIIILATTASICTAQAFNPQPDPPRESAQVKSQPATTAQSKPSEKPQSDGRVMQDYVVQRQD
jgi:hypothetical protein